MPKVTVCAKVSEEHYLALVEEAKRRDVAVETLIEQMVNGLMRELEEENESKYDHTISVS
jgi:hypothetical protein